MKILYFSDIHGNISKYNKILDIIEKKGDFDIVINGGDILPKLCEKGLNIFQTQQNFIEGYYKSFCDRFEKNKSIYLYIVGNDDYRIFDKILYNICENDKVYCLNKIDCFNYNSYSFYGFSLVNDYPFRLKDRCRLDYLGWEIPKQLGKALLSNNKFEYNEISIWNNYISTLSTIEEELNKISFFDNSKSILVSHMPPANIDLDVCMDGRRVGSQSLYKFIKNKQPKLVLSGHIHESFYKTEYYKNNIGDSIAIQPGQLEDNFLTYVIIDLDKNDIKRESVEI